MPSSDRPEYATVPDGRDVAEVDPHWAELATPGTLPTSYLPPAVAGQQHGWRKVAAWVLIVLMTSAATGGVCLTYGPGELFALFRNS
ncbi:MAG: hypothetical protein JWM64_2905 [Frankiales bacterium]|nr:hypothetical protein [Frankiales bacterium]